MKWKRVLVGKGKQCYEYRIVLVRERWRQWERQAGLHCRRPQFNAHAEMSGGKKAVRGGGAVFIHFGIV